MVIINKSTYIDLEGEIKQTWRDISWHLAPEADRDSDADLFPLLWYWPRQDYCSTASEDHSNFSSMLENIKVDLSKKTCPCTGRLSHPWNLGAEAQAEV